MSEDRTSTTSSGYVPNAFNGQLNALPQDPFGRMFPQSRGTPTPHADGQRAQASRGVNSGELTNDGIPDIQLPSKMLGGEKIGGSGNSGLHLRHHVEFAECGFTLVRGGVDAAAVAVARAGIDRTWRKAKRGEVGAIRVYDDFPPVLGGVNVAAIEDPFVAVSGLAALVVGSRLDLILRELTGWAGADLDVARVHVNDRFRYRGFWHRDARPEEAETSVVAVMYLRDEEGFRILPTGEEHNASPDVGDELQAEVTARWLPGEHVVCAKAGDILLMNSYLLHRGNCIKRRSHLHLRFVPGMSCSPLKWTRWRFEGADWRPAARGARWRNFLNYLTGRSMSSFWQVP